MSGDGWGIHVGEMSRSGFLLPSLRDLPNALYYLLIEYALLFSFIQVTFSTIAILCRMWDTFVCFILNLKHFLLDLKYYFISRLFARNLIFKCCLVQPETDGCDHRSVLSFKNKSHK